MKMFSKNFTRVAAGCAFAATLAMPAAAQVSNDDFNALKKLVQDLGEKVNKLEQTHGQDQKAHDQDVEQIQQLKQQLSDTLKTATEAEQKADAAAAAKVQGPSATHNFTMVGDAEVQFGKTDGQHSAFALADFAPIFMFRARENVLFEAGFDIGVHNNVDMNGNRTPGGGASTSVDLSFAQLDYMMNDYMTFVGGYMLLPLGTYTERGAGWINKIPDDPLARDFLPSAGAGIQLRGAVPVGESGQHLTYAVYGANGPSDQTGTSGVLDLSGNAGDTPNWHSLPSGGGRVGWFIPWKPHYDLELGVSGQTGSWDDAGNHKWSAAVIDAALHVSPYLEVKGEYIHSWVENDPEGFTPRGWWVQAGYKLAGLNLELPLINNLELVGRYDSVNDGMGSKTDRYTIGYVYYITNTLLFQGDYEFLNSNNPDMDHNAFVFQVAYGF